MVFIYNHLSYQKRLPLFIPNEQSMLGRISTKPNTHHKTWFSRSEGFNDIDPWMQGEEEYSILITSHGIAYLGQSKSFGHGTQHPTDLFPNLSDLQNHSWLYGSILLITQQ
jgi:hypothetical protein